MPETYRYDAFISYRHVEPDRKWAKWLHKALETFKTPKPLVAKGIAPRIRRVFRDEDELPASADLSSEIDKALQQSRFLIVVCSPRTPESQWVNQEVVRFREMGRHDRILAVLIEGEPHESFPRSLREIRRTITDEHGEVREHIEDVEPLAADVRASRDESAGFLKRMALLRCSAALLGCRFDDLRRREAERRKRRVVAAASASLVVALAFAGLSVFAFSEQARAEGEWERAESERDAKSAALDRVLRLADSKKVRDLLGEVERLWPLHPDKAADMAAWIERAQDVYGSRRDHQETLAKLREKALPYTEQQRLADHASDIKRTGTLRDGLVKATEALAALAQDETDEGKAKHEALERRIGDMQEGIEGLKSRVREQATWHFASDTDAWRHQVLSDLVRDLGRLQDEADPKQGALGDVRARHDFVSTLRRESVEDHREAWDATIAAIAASPKYRGLKITPQLGLIPLGTDPDSGLFEFAHLGSGTLPTRDEMTERLVQADDAGIVLVLIPGATFLMGAQKEDETKPRYDPGAIPDESPVHEVTLSPYLLSKYECTQAQWAAMTGGLDPSNFKAGATEGDRRQTPRNPVEQVSWKDCVSDPGWLVRNRLVLPTEAQWEYACRAGTDTPWITGAEVAKLGTVANIADAYVTEHGGPHIATTPEVHDGHSVHAPVGTFAANAFGLHDVHGNVCEWCRDTYGDYPQDSATDPAGQGSMFPLVRGGSWGTPASDARSAHRRGLTPEIRNFIVGFRAARSVTP